MTTRKSWTPAKNAPKRLSGRKAVERRIRWLRANPLCVACAPRVTAAEEVDHVIPLSRGGRDDESNFQSLCVAHHKAKSLAERGYTARPKRTIDANGWPVDEQ